MAFQVSPGVQIREFDLTAIVPAVSTTPAAYVGVFQWGPADQRILINTEKQLESIFFKPLNDPYYATSWLMASNFLSYGGNLQVVRSVSNDETIDLLNGNDANSLSYRSYPLTVPGGTPVSDPPTNYQEDTRQDIPLVYQGPSKGCVYADGPNAGLPVLITDSRYVAPRRKASNHFSFAYADVIDYETKPYGSELLSTFFPSYTSTHVFEGNDCSGDGCCGTKITATAGYFSPVAEVLLTTNVTTGATLSDYINIQTQITEIFTDCNCDGVEDSYTFAQPLQFANRTNCTEANGYGTDSYCKQTSICGADDTRYTYPTLAPYAQTFNFLPTTATNDASLPETAKMPTGDITKARQLESKSNLDFTTYLSFTNNLVDLDTFNVNKNNIKVAIDKICFGTDAYKNALKAYVDTLPEGYLGYFAYSNYVAPELNRNIGLMSELYRQTAAVAAGFSFVPGTYDLTGNLRQIKNRNDFEDKLVSGALVESTFYGKYPGSYLNGLGIAIYAYGFDDTYNAEGTDNPVDGYYPSWARSAFSVFGSVPTTTDQAVNLGYVGDEIHVALVDIEGKITGVKGQVLEYFEGMSVASDAKKSDGSTNYWKSVINNKSQYLYVAGDTDIAFKTNAYLEWGTSMTENTSTVKVFKQLYGSDPVEGTSTFIMDGGKISGARGTFGSSQAALSARILNQYETSFGDPDESDISIIIGYNTTIPSDLNDLIAIAENRKDSITFVSACHTLDLVGGPRQDLLDGIIQFADAVSSTSYGAMDSGYKYQYDRFNNVYRYVPMCADSAGCAVRTDNQKDPWWSPAGYDRGRILNVVKLVFNPNKTERDELYKKNVNPIITSQGFGVILFGDKTLQKKPSAFDRINVRRLFNVLEKSIATAAKFQLFEFNDAFTRSQFKQLVEPFLREIQGRRGITSYAVVCDESNNTPTVIDSNRFVADIFVAPNRSINFIQLNFVATPTGVSFAEYGG